MFNLKDKVAIVTGGAEGLGFAFVKELLNNGVRVRSSFISLNKFCDQINLFVIGSNSRRY